MDYAGENAINDSKELMRLCRTGRLYEVESWIASGKSLDITGATKNCRRKSLIEVAVETGFHSLVELIAKNGASSTSSKDAALALAVSLRRLDIVDLLCATGAAVRSVPFADVLLTWEPSIIRFFLDHGADFLSGRPFAEAFGERTRTALRAFLDCKNAHPEFAGHLQEQIDCALRYFCGEGDLKWVSLLIWAGGDPRSRGPVLNEEYTEDPECFTTGLRQACHAEGLDVLKKLKPQRDRDDLSELLQCAAFWSRTATIEYLLELGTDPNDKPNGGSSAVDRVLRNMSFAPVVAHGTDQLNSRFDIRQAFDCISVLASHGAVWRPDSTYDLTSFRRALLHCMPSVTIDLLQVFRKCGVCPAETVHKLLGTPQMKEHMKSEAHALQQLGLHLDTKPGTRGRRKLIAATTAI